MSTFSDETIFKVQESLLSGQTTVQSIVDKFLQRIQSGSDLNAFTEVNSQALLDAEVVDKKIKNGEKVGRLAGVPISLKDMICFKGMRVTAGSKMLKNYVAPYSATLVHRLLKEDAIIVGKCNQDEFAMGSSNEHSYFGPVKNPWNKGFVPGGSSGGSAAAVASGMCPVSIGTDTGGSIRQPAHFCGIVGLKPTYGRVSRYGVIAFASSLDQAGPLTRSVADAALVLEVISGKDKNDSTSSNSPVLNWSSKINGDLSGKTFGVPKQLGEFQLDQEVSEAFTKAQSFLKNAGAKMVEVDLPMLKYAVPVYYLVSASEASSNLARYDGVRYGYRSDFSGERPESLEQFYSQTRGEGFGIEVKRRIIMGTYFLSSGYYDAYFKKASQVRRQLFDEIKKAYAKCDVILSPVSTSSAFKINEMLKDPLSMYLNDILTVTANLVGQPGISVPVKLGSSGLPIGIQVLGDHFDEQSIFDFAQVIESQANFSQLEPQDVK